MRRGRHAVQREQRAAARRLGSPATWIGAFAAVCVVGAIGLSMTPAQAAATTVNAQLTLSGVASPDSPTGGSVVGVHPGDSVNLSASAVPTAGAPAGLDSALRSLVSDVAGLQVKITSSNTSRIPTGYVLGKVNGCGGHDQLALNALPQGSYSFTYVVEKVSLLTNLLGAITGCNTTTVTPTQDQLGKLTQDNVKFTDSAEYVGKIVAATDPPKGTIGVQLPKNSVSVKVGPIHTSVTLPGASVGVPNPLPSITSGLKSLLPGGKSSAAGSGHKTSAGPAVKYTPPALTVPQQVMPHAVANGGGGAGFAAPGSDSGAIVGAPVNAPAQPKVTSTAAAPTTSPAANVKPAKTVDLASKSQLSGQQLPVLLALVAILALAMVTAVYARLYLLRRTG